MKQALKITAEKGASSWVTATPLYDHGTILHKGDFVDAIYMRYGWTLPNLSVDCVCQKSAFTLQHALDCMIGGFRVIQHNEVRDVFAQLFRDAGHTVEVEPLLQKLSGEVFDYKSANKENDARSDIKVTGFWREMRQAFFDVKVVSHLLGATQTSAKKLCSRSQRRQRCANTENVFSKSSKAISTPWSLQLLAEWLLNVKSWSRNSRRSWLASKSQPIGGWMASSTAELRTVAHYAFVHSRHSQNEILSH